MWQKVLPKLDSFLTQDSAHLSVTKKYFDATSTAAAFLILSKIYIYSYDYIQLLTSPTYI